VNFVETKLKGAFILEAERFEDQRGFFTRTWSRREFAKQGLNTDFVESNVSFNLRRGTLRGMHYQVSPHAQEKIVRCTMGAIYDVAIDLRSESPTFKEWVAVELSERNRTMFFIPAGFAHGFLTLEDNSEVFYQMSNYYAPESARGVRWDDPAFDILWPATEGMIIIARDREYPDFIQ
jgi:dTDP-4-dehydrorhamnose 3,5-epimerase